MKVLKDSAIYLIGELTSKSIPFLLLPYLSRKLGVEGYGLLSYYQTYLALFAIVIGLSQEGAVARYFYFYGKRSLNLVVYAGYAYALCIGGIILLVCWILQSEILAYLAISALFQCFLSVQLSIRQCQKQAIPYTVIQLLSTIISALFTVLMLEYFQTDLVEKRILAILFSNLTVFCIAYLLYRKYSTYSKRFSLRQYKLGLFYNLAFGLPLLLHHISIFLKGQIDRIFIYHQFSELDLGLYAMGAQIATILGIIIMAVNKATIPYLYENLKKQMISVKDIHRWAFYSLVLIPIPAIIIWFIPESLILWVLGKQFIGTKYYILMFLISTALIIPYLILVNYLFYYGKNKLISLCSMLSTGIYLIALFWLSFTKIEYIPYASIISAITILIILYFVTIRVSKDNESNSL